MEEEEEGEGQEDAEVVIVGMCTSKLIGHEFHAKL